MSNQLETITLDSLHLVTGGAGAPQKPAAQKPKNDYATHGNPVQQGGQMIDNAYGAYQGARKAGASVFQSIGNAAIGAFNLGGGFDKSGKPRPE